MPKVRFTDVAGGIEPYSPGNDKRTFECPVCDNVVSQIVKYRRD